MLMWMVERRSHVMLLFRGAEPKHSPSCCRFVVTPPSSDFLFVLAAVADARCWSVGVDVGWENSGPMSWCWVPMWWVCWWHAPSIFPPAVPIEGTPNIMSECCSPSITCMEWTLPRESAWALALNRALVPVPHPEKSENKLSSNGPPSIFATRWVANDWHVQNTVRTRHWCLCFVFDS